MAYTAAVASTSGRPTPEASAMEDMMKIMQTQLQQQIMERLQVRLEMDHEDIVKANGW